MADNSVFCRTWKIVKYSALEQGVESPGIEGTKFTLDESGDVTWTIAENAEPLPFFNCETYEIYLTEPHYLKFIGVLVDHDFKFKIDQPEEDTMHLTYKDWCVLECEKMSKHDLPFSFLRALEERYFSDLSVFSSHGKEFKIHKTILKLGNPAIDWERRPCPLNNLSEDTLYAILYYLYCECLPVDLQVETAKSCLLFISKQPGFERFQELCELFLKNSSLKQQIIALMVEIHMCLDHLIEYFGDKTGDQDSPLTVSGPISRGIRDNPSENIKKLCYGIEQALREIAVVGVKIFILCDLYLRRKNELSKEEKHEIMKYCKSRLLIFMKELRKLLDVLKVAVDNLSLNERVEIVLYLLPVIEETFDYMFPYVIEGKNYLERIINSSKNTSDKVSCPINEKSKKSSAKETLGCLLKNTLYKKKLKKIKKFHRKLTIGFMNVMDKKKKVSQMDSANKEQFAAKSAEQVINVIPDCSLALDQLHSILDKVPWKKWKKHFKSETSKVVWVLNHLVCRKTELRSMILYIRDFVDQEQFTRSLVQIGLLDIPLPSESLASPTTASQSHSQSDDASNVRSPMTSPVALSQMGMVESLYNTPALSDSMLAKNAIQLLKSGHFTDMSFKIATTQDTPKFVVSHGQVVSARRHGKQQEADLPIIKAHRVIIASRCDWFRKALLSGKNESLPQKIVIQNTSPKLFQIFLEYLYGGKVDTTQLSAEELADLRQLNNRYEVNWVV